MQNSPKIATFHVEHIKVANYIEFFIYEKLDIKIDRSKAESILDIIDRNENEDMIMLLFSFGTWQIRHLMILAELIRKVKKLQEELKGEREQAEQKAAEHAEQEEKRERRREQRRKSDRKRYAAGKR